MELESILDALPDTLAEKVPDRQKKTLGHVEAKTLFDTLSGTLGLSESRGTSEESCCLPNKSVARKTKRTPCNVKTKALA